jgi:hypothetical protein
MKKLAALALVISLTAIACSSSDSSSSSAPPLSDPFVGHFDFVAGSVVINCTQAPAPITIDLTQEVDGKPLHYFDDTSTGDSSFHHHDSNDCQFDFAVTGSVATINHATCSAPDGQGGKAQWNVDVMQFTSQPDGTVKTVGSGTWGGCPMTLNGVARRS